MILKTLWYVLEESLLYNVFLESEKNYNKQEKNADSSGKDSKLPT